MSKRLAPEKTKTKKTFISDRYDMKIDELCLNEIKGKMSLIGSNI